MRKREVNEQPFFRRVADEIRKQVCGRCVERPHGGPPCAPLGKQCGVEVHLPQLIEAIHEIKSGSIVPYLENNRQRVCQYCGQLDDNSVCPCRSSTWRY